MAINVYWQTDIGFAMHKLGMGWTEERISTHLLAMAADRNLDFIPDTEIIALARENLAAKEALDAGGPAGVVREAVPWPLAEREYVGARVVLFGKDSAGNIHSVSVVINVGRDASRAGIQAAAVAVYATNQARYQVDSRDLEIVDSAVVALFRGGLQGAIGSLGLHQEADVLPDVPGGI